MCIINQVSIANEMSLENVVIGSVVNYVFIFLIYGTGAVVWVSANAQNLSNVKCDVIVAGYRSIDHTPLWVIKADVNGDNVVGKLRKQEKRAFICWGGKVHEVSDFEVCCKSHSDEVVWLPHNSNKLPECAIPAGSTADGENLYIGRAVATNEVTPGVVILSKNEIHVPVDGEELSIKKQYDVLCAE